MLTLSPYWPSLRIPPLELHCLFKTKSSYVLSLSLHSYCPLNLIMTTPALYFLKRETLDYYYWKKILDLTCFYPPIRPTSCLLSNDQSFSMSQINSPTTCRNLSQSGGEAKINQPELRLEASPDLYFVRLLIIISLCYIVCGSTSLILFTFASLWTRQSSFTFRLWLDNHVLLSQIICIGNRMNLLVYFLIYGREWCFVSSQNCTSRRRVQFENFSKHHEWP